jgi:hypothetical protein
MKTQIDILDATPSKRIYLSIIADYDLNKAICELIDNALDIWVSNGRSHPLEVKIRFDMNQQRIDVADNAGGIHPDDLSYVVGPGHTGTSGADATIGIFGVGTKRAVVALAQEVRIRTRRAVDTFLVEFDDSWINDTDDWHLPVYTAPPIQQGSTQIELLRLRNAITEDAVANLAAHLGATYARFLHDKTLAILVDDAPVTPIEFETWAYPPGYEPRAYEGSISTSAGDPVTVRAVAGLATESSPAGGEYGVYFYCNDRLVARGLKTFDVGFAKGLAGKPHADISLARVIVSLNRPARLMPWNSSKSDINPSHEVFISLRSWLLQVVKDFTSLARRLSKFEGGWPANVFAYTSGKAIAVTVEDFPSVNASYLPPLPESKPHYSKTIKKANKAIGDKKPWTIGLYESIIAVDWVLKQSLDQKNRIGLLLLDSTLEIAFKEYLVNDSGDTYNDAKLLSLFSNRHEVHKEIRKYVKLAATDWQRIEHYYRLRCLLIHQKASVAVSDTDVIGHFTSRPPNNSLQLTRLACGKLERDLPSRMRENGCGDA